MARFTAGARSMTKGERLVSHYNSARANLLLAMIFTVVNSVLACIGGNMYFLFSITFPYSMVSEGAFWTGMMGSPEEYAELGFTEADMMPMWFLFVMRDSFSFAFLPQRRKTSISSRSLSFFMPASVNSSQPRPR